MKMENQEKKTEIERIDKAIREAEEEHASEGVLLDAREAVLSLRMKHFE